MDRNRWQIILGIVLVVFSTFFYAAHYLLFRDAHHIFIFLFGDIAFVFVEVLLVTLIIHRLLGEREKRSLMEKLNMLIGAFFSDFGTDLLKAMVAFDPDAQIIKSYMEGKTWEKKTYQKAVNQIRAHHPTMDLKRSSLTDLKALLLSKRGLLLRMIENPTLLENESFTKLLWALFHLTDELAYRNDLSTLSKQDAKHMEVDMERAYGFLILEWMKFMKHLKENYPFLFHFAVRTNPFNAVPA
jgi:hypothetical protein